jgi:lysozyme
MIRKLIAWIKSKLSPEKVGAPINKTPLEKAEERLVELNIELNQSCNPAGLKLIMEFEGLYLQSYRCPAGVWTVGYGTTIYPNGKKVKHGEKVTKRQAKNYLQYDLTDAAVAIASHARKCKLTLSPNQFSALVSFAYNLGTGPVVEKNRTMGGALRDHDYQAMAEAFLVYNKARVKGKLKELKGLTRRRKAERTLFLS